MTTPWSTFLQTNQKQKWGETKKKPNGQFQTNTIPFKQAAEEN